MISFKGIVKYLIYIFIAGWMFLLGIMVGRGSSPVTFDTKKFQNRLETIASEFGDKKVAKKKIELKFYEVLDNPVAEEGSQSKEKTLEIIPKRKILEESVPKSDLLKKNLNINTDTIPVKKSRKRLTLKQAGNKEKSITNPTSKAEVKKLKSAQIKKRQPVLNKSKPSESLPGQIPVKISGKKPGKKPDKKTGKYTIQVAAYKDFKDAVTHMSILEKKGFTAYRQKIEKDGIAWYRVRIGSFASYDDAKLFKEKLNKAKVKSMITQNQ